MEQPLDALVVLVERRPDLAALIRVPEQLVDRFAERVLDGRTLEFGHDQRNAIDKADSVRDDVAAPAGQFHFELVDDQEVVVAGVLPVDVAHRLRAAMVPVRQPLHHRALQQKLSDRLVDLHQAVSGSLFEVVDGLVDAGIVQPGLAAAQVDPP